MRRDPNRTDLVALTNQYQRRQIGRRDFLARAIGLGLSAAAAQTLLAACSPAAAPTAAPAPTTAPAATSAPAPTAAPAATAAPTTAPAAATAAPTKAPAAATTAPTAAPAASAVKRGGVLTEAINWTIPTMDPHLTTIREHMFFENVYEGLVRFKLVDAAKWQHDVVGVLAESWEQTDSKTIVFKLRKGVKFHDGSEFDADVAVWNFLRARDHAKSQVKATLTWLDSAKAIDKSTLELKSKNSNAAMLRIMALVTGPLVRMVSKSAFDKQGEEWLQRNPVGTGPFKLKQWITDDRAITEKHADYWDKGADGKPLPYLDGFITRYVPDPTVSMVDMRSGSVHLVEWVPPKDVQTIKQDSNLTFQEFPWAGQIYFMCGYNASKPPFDKLEVRQAANYGIDRVAMHKALGFGLGAPHYYPYWAQGTMGYDESILKYEYNPDKVKQLLTQAGFPNGVEVELKVIAREPELTIGEFVQQMWTAVGIKTKLVSQERLSWIDAVRANNFQACFWRGNLGSIADPELMRTLMTCGAPSNWQAMCDKDVDRLMDEGLAQMDPAKRAAVYTQIFKRIQEQAYAGTGFVAPMVFGFRKELQGFDFNFQTPNLRTAWLK